MSQQNLANDGFYYCDFCGESFYYHAVNRETDEIINACQKAECYEKYKRRIQGKG